MNPDDAPPRDRLIENAVRIAAHGGISHLSLRQLALELGTSHRMLIYHFGSRDGLVAEIVRIVEEQQRDALDFLLHNCAVDPHEQAALLWDHVVDAASTFGPLFFELTGQALQGRRHTTRLLDLLVTGDRAAVDAAMELLARMVQTEVATGTAARPPGMPQAS